MLNEDKEPDATRVPYLKGNVMGQNLTQPDELDYILAEMKLHQRRDMLLRIDEILAALDMASPAADQWKAARRSIQLIEGDKSAAMRVESTRAAHGDSPSLHPVI